MGEDIQIKVDADMLTKMEVIALVRVEAGMDMLAQDARVVDDTGTIPTSPATTMAK